MIKALKNIFVSNWRIWTVYQMIILNLLGMIINGLVAVQEKVACFKGIHLILTGENHHVYNFLMSQQKMCVGGEGKRNVKY